MSSTYLSLYYHLVFSTRNREATIDAAWRERCHAYLGGIVNDLKGQSLGVGGTNDHIHLLVQLSATHRLSDFMRDLKKGSSLWIGDTLKTGFAWQEGYAALTVSASAVEEVRRYIKNQEKHHLQLSYRDEVLTLLRKSGVEVDERYFD